jgi:hypothetical protein
VAQEPLPSITVRTATHDQPPLYLIFLSEARADPQTLTVDTAQWRECDRCAGQQAACGGALLAAAQPWSNSSGPQPG